MSPRIQITSSLQLTACIARSHGATDPPSGAGILADRVNSVAIIESSNTLGLPRCRAICRFGSRHSYRRELIFDVLLGNHLWPRDKKRAGRRRGSKVNKNGGISGRRRTCRRVMKVSRSGRRMRGDQQLDPSKPSFMAMEIIKSLNVRVEILEAF